MTVTLPEGAPEFQRRLAAEFDLSWDDLRDRVLMRAQAVARSYDAGLYPSGAAGQVRYIHLVRHLSEVLLPLGWERRNDDNVPRLIHGGRHVALVITSGNAVTGLPWSHLKRHPQTKYPKGDAVKRVVERNVQPKLPFFEDDELFEEEVIDLEGLDTWFLMVFVGVQHIQSELSLPAGVNSRGFVCEWKDRILLPVLPNDGTAIDSLGADSDGDDDEDSGGSVEVPVEPR